MPRTRVPSELPRFTGTANVASVLELFGRTPCGMLDRSAPLRPVQESNWTPCPVSAKFGHQPGQAAVVGVRYCARMTWRFRVEELQATSRWSALAFSFWYASM